MGCMSSQPQVDQGKNAGEDPLSKSISRRQTAGKNFVWVRENTPVTEIYDVLKIVGQGSMGEVSIVQKKKDAVQMVAERALGVSRSTDDLQALLLQNVSAPVPLGTCEKKPRQYACKTINTLRFKDNEILEFINEFDILRDLDHPNIVQLFEVYKVKRKMWIITELCTGGDLTSRMGEMTEADVAIVIEQILRAVYYMHTKNVCHRDLKLENILYADSSPNAPIKLIDFGLSNKFTKGEKMLKACGTIYAAAPELLLGNGYTEKADIWSTGVVAFVLLSETYPFLRELDELMDEEKKNKFANAHYTFGYEWNERGITKLGKQFVASCLSRHPGSRWTAHEALDFVSDQWIRHLESVNIPTSFRSLPPTISEDGSSPDSSLVPKAALDRSVAAMRKRTRVNTGMVQGMGRFVLYGELKKTILMTMAYTMDKSSLHELREAFTVLDSSGTGTVSLVDLKNALANMHSDKHMDDATIEKLFRGIDVENSGQIHYNEFLAAVVESQGLITMEHLAEAFDRMDADGKGYISKEDLKNLLGTGCNDEKVRQMIDEADFKKSGQIDYEEFLRIMFEDPAKGVGAFGNSFLDSRMAQKLAPMEPSREITRIPEEE